MRRCAGAQGGAGEDILSNPLLLANEKKSITGVLLGNGMPLGNQEREERHESIPRHRLLVVF